MLDFVLVPLVPLLSLCPQAPRAAEALYGGRKFLLFLFSYEKKKKKNFSTLSRLYLPPLSETQGRRVNREKKTTKNMMLDFVLVSLVSLLSLCPQAPYSS